MRNIFGTVAKATEIADAQYGIRQPVRENGKVENTLWSVLIVFGLIMAAVVGGAFWTSVAGLTPEAAFEVRRLLFAAGVLAVLAFLLVLGVVVYVASPVDTAKINPAGKEVFDAFIKIIPPIITLVLGFYFGQIAKPTSEARPASTEQPKTDQKKGLDAARVQDPNKSQDPPKNPSSSSPPTPAGKDVTPPADQQKDPGK